MWRTILGGVTAAGLMGGTALAQQVILVPGLDGQAAGAAQAGQQAGQTGAQGEQRFILVPAPRFAPDTEARGGDSAMALELYRRGYQQGVSDAGRLGAGRQQFDPAAIERIGRELFERGYVLGMMQAQFQTAQQAAARQVQEKDKAGQQQAAAGQQMDRGTDASQTGQSQTGQTPADQQTAQAKSSQGGQATGQQNDQSSELVKSGVGATAETDVPEATIRAEESQQYGQHLVDANGRAVYIFTADKQAQGGAQNAASTCRGDCAQAWPPVLTRSTPVNAGEAVDGDLLGTIERQDGTRQVTYDGWPLYYYGKDQGADEATGQDVHGFGGEWYLLTPDGKKVGEG